ncbi:hypothetical protein BRE01_47960 [Brevibacillus reuszeri]|uniref:Uncharacterized protein n=1 Tax=Brevibacillus reuszeri TaxID=54915 RepID=A0A0K9YYW8_9BACL|nr:hypothetical protein ADS79_07870 [Brevibacillus reuszeri]GED71094.1 hypothetical protein BRE01_47960 [Brevibacillus reuszeri]
MAYFDMNGAANEYNFGKTFTMVQKADGKCSIPPLRWYGIICLVRDHSLFTPVTIFGIERIRMVWHMLKRWSMELSGEEISTEL